jgi:protein TonB
VETANAMQERVQERLIGALGSSIVVTTLGYMLFVGMAVDIHARTEQVMTLLDLRPPRPHLHPRQARVMPQKTVKASGKASPRNLHNKATDVVTPPPIVILPAPSPIVSAPKAGPGMASSAGASDRPGPGEGAGGQGDGSGSGGYGNGDGDGDVPPRQIKGGLSEADLPADLIQSGSNGGTVSVRYNVSIAGGVSGCRVMASSGSAELDGLTCRLIEQRFHFAPAHDRQGRPFPSIIEEDHSWEIERPRDRQGGR